MLGSQLARSLRVSPVPQFGAFELLTVQPQELSRFFETPEYLNMAAVHHLVHPCDSIVHIRLDYNRASRPL
jgi:hypothetical protein